MRIANGKTDQKIYFTAVDENDLLTPVTGLGSWTVYRSRNGGSAVAMTTPTVTEIDAVNMMGLYALTVDEDTTIASTSLSEELCLRITAPTMASVSRTVEIYRPELDRVIDTGDGYTLHQLLRGLFAVFFAKWSKSGNTLTYRDISDTKNRVSADVTSSSRGASTLDLT